MIFVSFVAKNIPLSVRIVPVAQFTVKVEAGALLPFLHVIDKVLDALPHATAWNKHAFYLSSNFDLNFR